MLEDGIAQKVATFAEGKQARSPILEDGTTRPLISVETDSRPGPDVRARLRRHERLRAVRHQQLHVSRFVYASDAIADFVRGLDRADSVAVYTFSRNLLARLRPDAPPAWERSAACARRWPATTRRSTIPCC